MLLTLNRPDYYELFVQRTETATGCNRLVRFIVAASERADSLLAIRLSKSAHTRSKGSVSGMDATKAADWSKDVATPRTPPRFWL